MKLLIVESPAKAKTINKYLGDDYKVVASIGHIRDLPKSNKKAIDIEGGFIPHYEVSKGKEKVVREIKELAKKADEVLLATDPDREGEAIAWHIAEIISDDFSKSKAKSQKQKAIKRVTYHEITEEAIKEALKHPRNIDENLKEAQEARRVLDRLVGYDLSGLIWKKVRYGLSAGRVQSPALRILMEREREIRAFKPETFYVLNVDLETNSKDKFTAFCEVEPRDKAEADRIYEVASAKDWRVVDISETEVKRSPRPPFTTSSLQQAASTRLGFSPKRTMMAAQKLYEAGYITYMRTDSTSIASVAMGQIKSVINKKFGSEHYSARQFKTKSKNAQEAHEAIRPTHFERESLGSTDDQKKLYNLIWQRTVSSQMKEALTMRTKITVQPKMQDSAAKSVPDFAAHGSRIVYDGWLLADPRAKSEDVILPKVKKSDTLALVDIKSEEKQTEPPNRYSEAGLIKELEKRGIGRPSTYASIINTIIEREYVEKDGKTLKPTDMGDIVSTFLENNFEQYISDTFTAEMEDKLDDIAEGKREYLKTLKEFYGPFIKEIKSKEKIEKINNLGEADPKWKCPKCGSGMVIKIGKGGKFMSCDRFPECEGMRGIDGEEVKEAESLGNDPTTGLPIFVMDGRYGPYVQLGNINSKSQTPNSKKIKEKSKVKSQKPKRASIPKDKDPNTVTLEEALHYLSLPRELGVHPDTGEMISANIGRFGPYIVHQKDFRSLKPARNASQSDAGGEDDVYTISLERALEILREPKTVGRRGKKK